MPHGKEITFVSGCPPGHARREQVRCALSQLFLRDMRKYVAYDKLFLLFRLDEVSAKVIQCVDVACIDIAIPLRVIYSEKEGKAVSKVGIGRITRMIQFHSIFAGWTYLVAEYAAFLGDAVMSKRRKRVDQDEEQSQNRLASSSQADAATLWRLWGSLFILRHNVPQDFVQFPSPYFA